MGVYRGKFGDIWDFRYPNNRRIKNILIPSNSIVWVEENNYFWKFISITPSYFSIIYIKYILNMYAKFEECAVYISLKSG
jgi:hypothetical protein